MLFPLLADLQIGLVGSSHHLWPEYISGNIEEYLSNLLSYFLPLRELQEGPTCMLMQYVVVYIYIHVNHGVLTMSDVCAISSE